MRSQEIIELIVREVVKRLSGPGRKALAVFTGGTAAFEEAVSQMKKMQAGGWDVSILFTAGAEKIYERDDLRRRLEGFELFFESCLEKDHDLLDRKECILIPILTINTAAKIALGIADTPATHLISNALLGGIPIIAAKDACNPGERMGSRAGLGAQNYARVLENHLKSLEDFGIRLVPCENLYEAAPAQIDKTDAAGKAAVGRTDAADRSQTNGSAKVRMITKEDIVSAKRNGSLRITLDKKTKITPYAREAAGELGVEIICISQT